MRILKTLVFILIGSALTAAAPVCAQSVAASDVSGMWTASFVTPDHTYPARIELKQDADKVTGAVMAPDGNGDANKVTGSVKGKDVTFAFATPDPGGSGRTLAIEVKATMGSDGLNGSFNVDDAPGGTFAATKAPKETNAAKESTQPGASKEPAPAMSGAAMDVSGTWALTVDLGSITASPTLLLKQDGGSLTGTYTSQQYGQFPIKGTIKGNQIQFGMTMAIEGNGIDVAFTGTADKDGLKGSVNYGGIGEGTFTGKKK
jgi:hypothetical protein